MPAPAVSRRFKSSIISKYGIVVASAAAIVALDLGVDRPWEINLSVSLFLCMLMLVAWTCGTGPALLASVLTLLALDYFFLEPIYSFALDPKEIARLMLFGLAALLIIFQNAAQRRAETSLQRTREEQQKIVRRVQQLEEELHLGNAGRQTEEKSRLFQSELRIIDAIPVLVACYRPDGSIEVRNKSWGDYTGLSNDNVDGDHWGAALYPDDTSMVEREWRAHIATGEPFDLEQRLRRADGAHRWHWVRYAPQRDESGDIVQWYGVAFDIHERRRAETALRESEAELAATRHELQLMIDTIPVLVLRHRADGVIDFVNQAVRSYSGLVSNSWTTRVTGTTHPDDTPRLEEAWNIALMTGEPFETEQRVRRADGEYRWFGTRRVPLRDGHGDVIAWYAASYDIEDRKRADDALRASEARLADARHELELTIDSIPVILTTFESDGTCSFVNKTWQIYTGHTEREALDKKPASLNYYHPDDVDAFDDAWRTAHAKGEMMAVDVRIRRADGVYRWHTIRRAPQRDESGIIVKWYSVGVDVEDQRVAENALREREAQLSAAERELRLTLDTIPTLAWRTQKDGLYLNKRWLDYAGFTLEQAQGWKWLEAIHPDDSEVLLENWRKIVASGKFGEAEARMRRFDGAYRWFLIRAEPLRDDAGAILGWYGTNTDIDERKEAESALHAAQSTLARANRIATLGEISATIAHEINQPLAAILANGQACLRLLRREKPDLDSVQGAIEWIVKDGNRAGEVIRRIRGLLKNADTQKTPLDANHLIEEVAMLLKHELTAKQVSLRLELGAAVPLVIADRVQLQQVIINLMMNGAEAMQGLTDHARELAVHSYVDEARRVVISVKDTGIGIPQESADRVFDPFFTTKPEGLGMGLSICRSIIESHGGHLWSSSNAGPGATFQFTMPSSHEDVT